MKIGTETLAVLKLFATINSNIVIHSGKKFSTISSSKDIMADYVGEVEFDNDISIFNLNELLGVLSAFDSPEIDLADKFLTVKEGKQKVKYIYADETLLTTPPKDHSKMDDAIKLAEVEFIFTAANLARIQKMAGVLAVEDLTFIGDGKKIIARVHDSKNPLGNAFDIDLETKTTEKFSVDFKVEKMKLFAGQDFDVQISSKKISKFSAKGLKLETFIAVESTSTFE